MLYPLSYERRWNPSSLGGHPLRAPLRIAGTREPSPALSERPTARNAGTIPPDRFFSGSVRQSHCYGFPAPQSPSSPFLESTDVEPRRRRRHATAGPGASPVPADVPADRRVLRPAAASARGTSARRRHRPWHLRPACRRGTVTRHARQSRRRSLTALAVACFLAFAAVARLHDRRQPRLEHHERVEQHAFPSHSSSSPATPRATRPRQLVDRGSSSSNGRQSSIDVNAIAAKVSPSIVNLTSTVDQGEAAGTGIVMSSSGLVLTNNHVIANSNQPAGRDRRQRRRSTRPRCSATTSRRRRARADRGRVRTSTAASLGNSSTRAGRRRDRRPRQRRRQGW